MRNLKSIIVTLICVSLLMVSLVSLASAAKVKLTVWHEMAEENRLDWMKSVVERAEQKYGFEVELVRIPGVASKYWQRLMSAAAAKEGPDVFFEYGGRMFKEKAPSLALALNKYFTDEELSHLQASTATVNGKLYGVPYAGQAQGIVYNAEIFKEIGLDPEPENFPKTWDGFIALLDKIKETKYKDRIISFANKEGYMNEWWLCAMMPQVFDTVGEMARVTSEEGSWVNPKVKKVFKHYKQLYTNGYFIKGGLADSFYNFIDNMTGGKTVLSFGLLGMYKNWNTTSEGTPFRMVKMPVFAEGEMAEDISVDSNLYAVFKYTDHPKEAAQLVKEFATKETAVDTMTKLSKIPLRDGWKDEIDKIEYPWLKDVFNQAADGSTNYFYLNMPSSQYDAMLRHTTLYLLGQESLDQCLKAIEKAGE